MAEKILVVDDDQEIAELIKLYLENEKFTVDLAFNGREGWEKIANANYDLLISDYMMPELNGMELAKLVRQKSTMPILIVSARDDTLDKVLGLTIGADDYIDKPFHPLELVARVKALLRRARSTAEQIGHEINVKDLTIDIKAHQVYKGEEKIDLTPKEFAILELLASYPGQVFAANQIFASIWQEEAIDVENVVMTHIRNLRQKLGDFPKAPKYIITVWGIGYKIEN